MAKELHHPALRAFSLSAVIRDLHNDLGARDGASGFFSGDKDIFSEPVIIRDHEAEAAVLLEGAHHLRHPPGQDADHLRLLPSSGITAEKPHLHRILMAGSVGFCRRNEQILPAAFHLHEAEALRMADEGSDDERRGGNRISPPPVHLDLSFQKKLLQQALQLGSFTGFHLHQAGKLLFLHRNIGGLLHERNDLLFSVFVRPRILLLCQNLPPLPSSKKSTLPYRQECFGDQNLEIFRIAAITIKEIARYFVTLTSVPSMERPLFCPQ